MHPIVKRTCFFPRTPPRTPPRTARPPRGFSLTELLVVIGIIALLAGVLLTAMSRVRSQALKTQTVATMVEFSKACEAFQLEHGFYPGVIPETYIADAAWSNGEQFSSTENALLHLMGGYRVLSPSDVPTGPVALEYEAFDVPEITFGDSGWKLKVDRGRIGEGPVIDGKAFAPYFTPGGNELGVAKGQFVPGLSSLAPGLPDLLDGWGQPIIYNRRLRTVGDLVGDASANPQFLLGGITAYTSSTGLGELGQDQTPSPNNQDNYSLLNISSFDQNKIFAQLIRHPAFGKSNEPLDGTARGAYVLFSAGPDGVFFSRLDGPGSRAVPIGPDTGTFISFGRFLDFGPSVIDEFDDVRIFGGG